MGEMKVILSDETERKFREAAMHEFGFQKGSISMAANYALSAWASKHEDLDKLRAIAREKIKGGSISSLRGILKHVKTDSVSLKHEISEIRAERWKKHAH